MIGRLGLVVMVGMTWGGLDALLFPGVVGHVVSVVSGGCLGLCSSPWVRGSQS